VIFDSKDYIKDRISVIVASYNHAKYLTERMDSLIKQTWGDVEIIVIDDKSPDNSLEILRPYKSYSQVILIESDKNSGWVNVSNRGISLATGEYVIFANCDDFCKLDQLEKMIQPLQQSLSICAVFSRSTMIDDKSVAYGDDFLGREKAFKVNCSEDTLIPGFEMSKFLLHSCVMPNLSGILFRTQQLKDAGGLSLDYKVCSDWDLFFKLAEKHDFYYLTEELNFFRQHRTTIRKTTKDRVVFDEYFKLLSHNIDRLPLTTLEKLKYTYRISTLWAQHIFQIRASGLFNLIYHIKRNFHYDPQIIMLLPFALVGEFFHKFYRASKSFK
jgi:glycosyltransferase involved in cell wall biosynthesis